MPQHTADTLNLFTSMVIAGAIEVHRAIGPGLLENAYLACLAYELHKAGVRFELQKPIPLIYRGITIDCAYRADLVVEDAVIVEVKALHSVAPIHSQQLSTYLRLANCRVGLLLNCGARLMKDGITRVANEFPE